LNGLIVIPGEARSLSVYGAQIQEGFLTSFGMTQLAHLSANWERLKIEFAARFTGERPVDSSFLEKYFPAH